MALGSTQPLTEMSISWGKVGRCLRLTTLSSCAFVSYYQILIKIKLGRAVV